MQQSEYALLGQIALGYAAQWLRGLKGVHNGVVYAGLAASSILVYLWITPAVDLTHNWRGVLAGFVSFLLAARGGGAASKDARIAPPADTL